MSTIRSAEASFGSDLSASESLAALSSSFDGAEMLEQEARYYDNADV